MKPLRLVMGLIACVALSGAGPSLAAAVNGAAGTQPVVVADQSTSSTSTPSLYKRLGGYDGIAALTDDFIGRLATDPQLTKFFTGLNDASKARVRQHVVDLLCQSTGGPCIYLGEDMKTAHKGLNITESDWNAAVKDLTASFDHFNVGQEERKEVVAKLLTLKPDIVQGH